MASNKILSAKKSVVLGPKEGVLAQETVLDSNKKFGGQEKGYFWTLDSCVNSRDYFELK